MEWGLPDWKASLRGHALAQQINDLTQAAWAQAFGEGDVVGKEESGDSQSAAKGFKRVMGNA